MSADAQDSIAPPSGLPAEKDGKFSPLLILIVAAISGMALIWFLSDSYVLAGAMGAGAILSLAIANMFHRPQEDAGKAPTVPDWSITRAAADRMQAGLAICDRAGRLVCANRRYVEWFPDLPAPPDLPFADGGAERLRLAARDAWRDGDATVDQLKRGVMQFEVRLTRSGSSEDYLIWLFEPIAQASAGSEVAKLVAGATGRLMAHAGVMAVTIGPEGRIRAANSEFAARAEGDENANITNRDFASFLRVDDRGKIFFGREGRGGGQLRLVHIPFDPDDVDGAAMILMLGEDGAGGDREAVLDSIEKLLLALPVGLALIDRDGRFLFTNEPFLRLAGIAADRMPPFPGDLVVREDRTALSETIRRHSSGSPSSSDLAVRLRDNPEEVIALSATGLRGLGDAAVLLTLRDDAAESQLKRQVAQATKMQAVGQLAGGVAHDFNNILTAILGSCDLMLMRHSPGDSDYDDIQQIRSNSNRAAALTRQLLAFSRQQTLRPQIVQLPDIVSEVSSLLKRLLGEKIRLEVSHGRNLGTVRADPGQLEQVIVNLAVNARDAMGEAGVLTIETAAVSLADVRALGRDIMPVTEYVRLSVQDSGHGIAKENLGKIFEPFFTTKDVGKGTGLGLATVYGIVKQSGGFIFAESPEGEGARFDIFFPVHRGEPEKKREARAATPARVSGAKWESGAILVVEDEDMVRAVAQRALEREGYQVTTAADGEEALELFKTADDPPDLVISDVVMPNMDGPTMARELRRSHPDIPILFMSGYAEEQLRKSIDLDNISFLPKPFTVKQINDAVRMILVR